MSKMQLTLVITYLMMTVYFFTNWLRFVLRHPSSSPEDKFLSFVMFFISTVLWPIVVPMSFVEILKTRKLEFSKVIPVLVVVCAFSLAFYMG
ncbi:hypothetical protein BZZ01_11985 [Nostocales cyanobacterium HT-58-2]|nr:hypothetical protein BZZ01_11985 [Nostocales cyanobacterium HT-58-2]